MEIQFNPKEDSGIFYWETDYYHPDNAFTMQDFLDNYLPPDFEIILDDGSYAEVQHHATDAIFSVAAKGNGDCFHHVVEWHIISRNH